MVDLMQVPTPVDTCSALTFSYAIGPIDPAHLTTLQARLSDGVEFSLLVPASLPQSFLNDPQFKEAYECGYLDGDADEEWTIPQVVNSLCGLLYRQLLDEWSPDTYTWIVGFLLGDLARLAETERTLALVGLAYLCFLLAGVPYDTPPCDRSRRVMNMNELSHRDAVCAYRTRVRLYRQVGLSFHDAQHKALVGSEA